VNLVTNSSSSRAKLAFWASLSALETTEGRLVEAIVVVEWAAPVPAETVVVGWEGALGSSKARLDTEGWVSGLPTTWTASPMAFLSRLDDILVAAAAGEPPTWPCGSLSLALRTPGAVRLRGVRDVVGLAERTDINAA
jgi:hypothetical protein